MRKKNNNKKPLSLQKLHVSPEQIRNCDLAWSDSGPPQGSNTSHTQSSMPCYIHLCSSQSIWVMYDKRRKKKEQNCSLVCLVSIHDRCTTKEKCFAYVNQLPDAFFFLSSYQRDKGKAASKFRKQFPSVSTTILGGIFRAAVELWHACNWKHWCGFACFLFSVKLQ